MDSDSIRLLFFGGVLALMAGLEALVPWRERAERLKRWPSNLGVVVLGSLLTRLVFPFTALGVALWSAGSGFGLLHWLSVPLWLAIIISVLALDCLIYAQHVLFHHVPLLWRLHRMHHADTVLDVTSGLRFHPLEILLSLALKCAAIAVLGAPAPGVLIFEILLNATAMFNHANIVLPPWLDRLARLVLVTPDMHRVHHSVARTETNSNFGFNLPWWDRLFGTYTAAPATGIAGMTIGLPEFRDPGEQRLDRLLTQPFRQPAAESENPRLP